jgi:hypothetical protein
MVPRVDPAAFSAEQPGGARAVDPHNPSPDREAKREVLMLTAETGDLLARSIYPHPPTQAPRP